MSDEKVWEFTFQCVFDGETYEQALSAALEYLAEYAATGELEPTASRVLGDDECEVVT